MSKVQTTDKGVAAAADVAKAVRRARDGAQFAINGEVVMVIRDADFGHEVKLSPKGLQGDFDTDCSWMDLNEYCDFIAEKHSVLFATL